MLDLTTNIVSKLLARTSHLVLIIFIASCSSPNFEAPSEIEQQAFIEITDSAIKPTVETKTQIPLVSVFDANIESTLETIDEAINESPTKSSCTPGAIDCHHFDYLDSVTFLDSIINYAHKNSITVPFEILSNLTMDAFIQVESLEQAKGIIKNNPEHLLILGQQIIRQDMPYEWLFAAEKVFLRNWSNLSG
ncbi:MAG: hypothetical protein QF407_02810 [Gammaproteobacteria bacterium]|jgi:hypothetical protein|nr:hypothetical protein [Gammaproteobacteria bacterium]MDP6974189.1 hypothetical protein [Gammaproteobacteria bacterium]